MRCTDLPGGGGHRQTAEAGAAARPPPARLESLAPPLDWVTFRPWDPWTGETPQSDSSALTGQQIRQSLSP